MAYTTINDPSAHFQTQLYTGNGGSQDITNGGNSSLQPDWLWIKQRSSGGNVSSHVVKDSNRGVTKEIYPNATTAEGTSSLIDAFLTDGFSINNTANEHYNYNNGLYASWQWKANGGTTASNTDGDQTSTVQANTTAGFSIATYSGDGSGNFTVGHGLGSTPAMYMVKRRDSTSNWYVWHQNLISGAYVIYLNAANTEANETTVWNSTAPTSSVFTIGTDANLKTTGNYIAYCFAEKKGYSKFGIYQGNSNANGAFVYTGFRPAWIMIKCSKDTKNWHIADSKRISYNGLIAGIRANTTDDENTGGEYGPIDFLSNGFKFRTSDNQINGDGNDGKYIYMAFAEHPFVSSTGTPTPAR